MTWCCRRSCYLGEAVTIRCAHGDNVLYSVTHVNLVVDGVPLVVEAVVSKSLPVSVLLGTDVPELASLVSGGKANQESETVPEKSSHITTKKQDRCFLGLTGYYRKFFPDYASIAAPDLTKKVAPNQVVWNQNCEASFQKLKELLCRAPVLRSPDFQKDFVLQTDASDVDIGAVLSQLDDQGTDHPVAYFSLKLFLREQKYSTIEKDCLAIKLGTQAARVYLLGKPFVIQTDHRASEWLDRLKENNA
ncbi:hypothetical protein EMCRGX_G001127 [Ephydatia muelleri]